ncbi:MAG TPA: cell wall-binding repeat-containing protein, partial [Acidimicrobiales bacterium]|nr:cell wall-binding repeat-containing protein [Acidimicrobiales bacterium]
MGSWLRARRPVRSATGLLAVALVMVVADTWSSHASTTFAFSRLAGSDRYETAKIIAEQTFASSGGAILATGERFPDALGGGYAAGVAHAPILLTTGATLPPVTVTALRDLNVTRVAILGGTAAVATAVEVDLNSRGYQTARIAGVDRYDTAKRVAEIAGPNAVGTIGGA